MTFWDDFYLYFTNWSNYLCIEGMLTELIQAAKKGECQLNNCTDRFIDMECRIKERAQINHVEGAGNTTSFSSNSRKSVPLRKIIAFD